MSNEGNDEPATSRRPSIDADDPRVIWAAERTLLAWIRTGLAMMGFGFLVARFGLFLRELAAVKGTEARLTPTSVSLWIGTGLVLLGVAVNLLAAWQHWRIERELYPTALRRWSRIALPLTVAMLLGAIGIAMAVYLVTVG